MRHKKLKKVILENIEITDASSEGKAVAKVNELVIFVDHAIPGDVADIEITKKKNKYREGKAVKIHIYSPKRVDPLCQHFGVCGGCKWQNMGYQYQLYYKQKQVFDALTRIGKLDIQSTLPIIGSKEIYYYRNKLEYSFSNKRWLTEEEVSIEGVIEDRDALGFHIPKMFDKILDIKQCHLQKEPSNAIRLFVKDVALKMNLPFFNARSHEGYLRNMIIRTSTTGELMVIVIFNYEDENNRLGLLNSVAEKFPEITSLLYVINEKANDSIFDQEVKVFKGNDHIYEQMEGLRFKIGPKSFYQTNSEQAFELYKEARNFAGIENHHVVYDLYTGTGTIANFVASQAKKVVGIEYIEPAIDDAKHNSQINKINNTSFFAGDIKDILTNDFINENGKPDIIITDPPRAGMHEDVVKKIVEIAPEKVVYISCNPATQARDILWMSEKYEVTKIQPVDMFPHTHHVENIVLLELKKDVGNNIPEALPE